MVGRLAKAWSAVRRSGQQGNSAEDRKATVDRIAQGHVTILHSTLSSTKASEYDRILLRIACIYGHQNVVDFFLKRCATIVAAAGADAIGDAALADECLQLVLSVSQGGDESVSGVLTPTAVWSPEGLSKSVRKRLLQDLPVKVRGPCPERYLEAVRALASVATCSWHGNKPSRLAIDRALRVMRGDAQTGADYELFREAVQSLDNIAAETNVAQALLVQTVCEAAGEDVSMVQALLSCDGLDPTVCGNFVVRFAYRYSPCVLAVLLADGRIDPAARSSEALRACVAHGKVKHVEMLLAASPDMDPTAVSLTARINYNGPMLHASALSIALAKSDCRCISRLVENRRVLEDEGAVMQLLCWSTRVRRENAGGMAATKVKPEMPFIHGLVRSKKLQPSMSKNALLIAACTAADLGLVKFLLAHTDPSAFDQRVICKCYKYEERVVRLLLRDPRVDPTCFNQLPLFLACIKHANPVVEALIDDPRVDPSLKNYCIIPMSAREGNVELLTLLIDHLLPASRVPGPADDNGAGPASDAGGGKRTPSDARNRRFPEHFATRMPGCLTQSRFQVTDADERQCILRDALLEACRNRMNRAIYFLLDRTDVNVAPIADEIAHMLATSGQGPAFARFVERGDIDPASQDDFLLRHHVNHGISSLRKIIQYPSLSTLRSPPGNQCALEIASRSGRLSTKLRLLLRHPSTFNFSDLANESLLNAMMSLSKEAVEAAAEAMAFIGGTQGKLPTAWAVRISTMALGNSIFVRDVSPSIIMQKSAQLLTALHELSCEQKTISRRPLTAPRVRIVNASLGSDGSLASPVSDGSMASPAGVGSLLSPASGESLASPVSDGVLASPVSHGSLASPSSGGSLASPSSDGSLASPASGVSLSTGLLSPTSTVSSLFPETSQPASASGPQHSGNASGPTVSAQGARLGAVEPKPGSSSAAACCPRKSMPGAGQNQSEPAATASITNVAQAAQRPFGGTPRPRCAARPECCIM